MGSLVFGAVMPHPPIIIEAVGGREREEAAKTLEGMEKLARDLVEAGPETIIFISPHGPVFEDGIVILGGDSLQGDFSKFGAPGVRMDYFNDLELGLGIAREAKEKGIFATVADEPEARRFGVRLELDHGVTVPLDYLRRAGFAGRIVEMGIAMFLPDELYNFGAAIQRAIEDLPRRVAVVASGDLSHRLTRTAPAGYNKRGTEFDLTVVEKISSGDFSGIMDMEPELVEEAGECGFRPLNILLGVFDAYRVETEVYSYEGPFGVGYLTASIKPMDKDGVPGQRVADFRKARADRLTEVNSKRHPLVALAVESLEYFLRTGKPLQEYRPLPSDLPDRAGTFVSIKKHGELRGCIGTISATQPSLAQEVMQNAISAGIRDPRFFPVELEELPELTFSVDVLGEEEEITGPEFLDPSRYGVIVRRGNRSGLLLPRLEGIDSVEEQLRITRQKAGIGPGEEVELSRFEVERYT